MNIFLGDKSNDLLKNENELKQKIAKFLAEPEQTQNAMIMTNLLLSSYKQDKILVFDFMQLPFHWVSGVFTSFSFIYRRLWMPLIISFVVGFFTNVFLSTFFISLLIFATSIFVFGKLHYYFLIKRFIEKVDLGFETDNVCAPNMMGVFVLLGAYVLIFIIQIMIYIAFAKNFL